ncbi:MAG: hypothetical protein E7271_03495 [Lachnospiraceae bacterium]|nr:hypothetical protein [Lachnospiraceae bacterium]
MLYCCDSYRDYAYLKKLGNSYKLIKCNTVKIKGLEKVDIVNKKESVFVADGYHINKLDKEYNIANFSCGNSTLSFDEHSNDEKLNNNICRARNKIIEYVLCNDFDYFITITLNPDLFDRHNLKCFIKKLGVFIQHYNARQNCCLKYIFIPEQHKDGCWHLHGFIMGLPVERLTLFDINSKDNLPLYIVNKIKSGNNLYYFKPFLDKFGFNVIEPIHDKKASVLYMCKYLTKDISRNVRELGNHLYYCSKGLKKAEVVKQGQFLDSSFDFDYSGQYCSESFFDSLDQGGLNSLIDKIGSAPVSLDDYKRGYRLKDGFYQYIDSDTGEVFGNIPDIMYEMECV